MADTKRVVVLAGHEQRPMVNCMRVARNEFIDDGLPAEDVSELMLKVIEAPTKKEKRKADREGR